MSEVYEFRLEGTITVPDQVSTEYNDEFAGHLVSVMVDRLDCLEGVRVVYDAYGPAE